jgi:hypothetical protein
MSKMIATQLITVDGFAQLQAGQAVDTDQLPQGCVKSMVRLKQLVDPEDWEAMIEPNEVPVVDESPVDWLETSVDELDLPANVVEALVTAELLTIKGVLAYGQEHGSLDELDGIGPASEKKIQEAIVARQPKQ